MTITSASPQDNPKEWINALMDQLDMQNDELPTMSVCVNTADWTNRTIQVLREIVKTQGLIIKAQSSIIDSL